MLEWKEIKEEMKVLRGKRLTKNLLDNNAEYPVFHGGIDPLGNYSQYNRDENTVMVINVGASAGTVGFCDRKFWSSDGCFCISHSEKINSKFLFYYLQCKTHYLQSQVRYAGIPTLDNSVVEKIKIPLLPFAEQNRIVGILDTFTSSIENLKEQIAQRRKQYEYYRDQLLIFDSNISWYELLDLCDYVDYRGKTPKKVDFGVFLVTAKNIRKGYIDYENSKEYVSLADYEIVMRRGKPKIGDVLITTEAPCGNVAQVDNDSIALAQRVIKYRPKDKRLNSTFLKYLLLGTDFQNRLDKEATGATVKGIKGSKLHKLKIPLPPLQEQLRIVSILDTFEASIQNLEAQLAGREKQYEYYRNKLLTFE